MDDASGEPAGGRPHAKGRRRLDRPFDLALGAQIRALRNAAGLSQAGLGAAVGVSFQQIQKYELGRDRISASTLRGIAFALGVHPGSFFDPDMSVPAHSVPDVRAALRCADAFGQISDPLVLKRLLALAAALADGQAHGTLEMADGASQGCQPSPPPLPSRDRVRGRQPAAGTPSG